MSNIRRLITAHGGLGRFTPSVPVAPYWEVEPPLEIRYRGMLVYADGVTWDPGSGEDIYYWSGTVWVALGTQGTKLYSTTVVKADGVSLGEPAPFDQVVSVRVFNADAKAESFILLERDSLNMAYSGFFMSAQADGFFDLAWDNALPAAARWSELEIHYIIVPISEVVSFDNLVTTDGDNLVTTDGDNLVART